jgi:hypothetical protein
MNLEHNSLGWQQANLNAFWNEVAPSDHLVQIYDDEIVFLNSLEGFAATGIEAGESVIIIATTAHLNCLEEKLMKRGFDLHVLIADDLFIPLNAEDLLSKFMVKGWPDERLFMQTVGQLVKRAKTKGRSIRAFGEMVALLWARDHGAATIRLEELWNKFCANEKFCLFCAYPRNGFTNHDHTAIPHICTAHSKEIGGWANATSDIYYKTTTS